MNRMIVYVWILVALLFSQCHSSDADVVTTVSCRLTGSTDQLVETSGKLTDELVRNFTYGNNRLLSITERSMNQQATFLTEYTDNHILKAVNGQDVITLTYAATSGPTSASFIRAGISQSTFTMTYNATGQMNRVVETRQVLPANSLTKQRDYTFTYDNTGNLTSERARSTLTDGVVVEQQTDYTFEQKPAPYTLFSELPLLTVVALSQAVEIKPGRFWHLHTPVSLTTYTLTSTGSRANTTEESTFVTSYNSQGNLAAQEQKANLYVGYLPDPVSKRNRQNFTYTCL